MKPLLLVCFFFVFLSASAQSLDYLSLRKPNGRVVKNFYSGSNIVAQLADGGYVQGPIQAVRNDSLFITIYDMRLYPTPWGGYVRDTITSSVAGLHYKDIKRVALQQRRGFLKRIAPPLLMIGGAGYLSLNVINRGINGQSIGDRDNLRRLGTAAGAFGLGFLLSKLFYTDGFSKKNQQLVYINL